MKTLAPRRAAVSEPAPEASAAGSKSAMPTTTEFDGYALMRTLHPAYAGMQDRFEKLTARYDEIICELDPINDRRRRDGSNDAVEISLRAYARAHPPAPPPPPRPGALALLEGTTAEPPPPRPPVEVFQVRPDDADYERLTAELADVEAALQILRPELERARLEASKKLAEHVLPLYRKVANRYILALIELGEAAHEHERFIFSVKNSAWSCLRPIAVADELGKPTDPASIICQLVGFAIDTGHISQNVIPPTWKVRRSHG